MNPASLAHPLLATLLAPLLLGIIQRTKAIVAGRRGQPLLQPYRDLAKLLGKQTVYSRTTTWIFRASPIVGLAALLTGSTLLPLGGLPAVLRFPGDFVLLVSLLGVARFLTILAALDTGSSFEGMGASRRAAFSALAEPALLLGLAALARGAGSLSLTDIVVAGGEPQRALAGPPLLLVVAALLVVTLAETSRIPVDDPTTHLELTMIHEAMVLDHGGPDLAFIHLGAALELWIFGAILVDIALPFRGDGWADPALFLGGMLALAVLVGLIESSMARLRLFRVPQLLAAATAFSALALLLALR